MNNTADAIISDVNRAMGAAERVYMAAHGIPASDAPLADYQRARRICWAIVVAYQSAMSRARVDAAAVRAFGPAFPPRARGGS